MRNWIGRSCGVGDRELTARDIIGDINRRASNGEPGDGLILVGWEIVTRNLEYFVRPIHHAAEHNMESGDIRFANVTDASQARIGDVNRSTVLIECYGVVAVGVSGCCRRVQVNDRRVVDGDDGNGGNGGDAFQSNAIDDFECQCAI